MISGTNNARDVGGLPAGPNHTQDRVYFRSDALTDLAPAAAQELDDLGVRTVLDLREQTEQRLHPAVVDGSQAQVISWPLIDGRVDLRDKDLNLERFYRNIVDNCGDRIAGAIEQLADGLPTVVFCSAGKDRTGIVTALTLSVAGVDEDAIIADYHQSEVAMAGEFRDRLVERAKAAGFDEQVLAVALGAPAELMRDTLGYIDSEHGGPVAYLRANGVSDDTLDTIRTKLVAA